MRVLTRPALKRLAVLAAALALLLLVAWWLMIRMPGTPYQGPREKAPDLESELRRDVERLCAEIGERNVFTPKQLAAAADWIEGELKRAGYAPQRQVYEVERTPCANLEAELPGGDEIVVIGAHYDSVADCPGANDNGSGVAATLALARRFAGRRPPRTLRFLFFVNEEPPFFQTDDMGSLRYARRCRERDEKIVAMVSLETIGYFTEEPESQGYPVRPLRWVYGDKGNFIGFIGNVASRNLVRDALEVFREHAKIPSHGIALPTLVPGVGWSDHWSFWQCGYDAIMVTDTAPFRYPHYHERSDTPDQIRYGEFAKVVAGLVPVVESLAGFNTVPER
jgi:hypothetical protein